ncbi:transforming growth factor beta-1 proprotein-like [Lepus europaeus]|uniref:transforming growth factor beta-1 proprotein-like n=1 Tax=Lepus europaeus TaxID=9983 RepID=UPI002B4A0570|nr:transforming growth factor beta-1 proprotein-like [Lepus europaeus]
MMPPLGEEREEELQEGQLVGIKGKNFGTFSTVVGATGVGTTSHSAGPGGVLSPARPAAGMLSRNNTHMELLRQQYIQAIGALILSKLGLSSPPSDDEVPTGPVPEDILALYNRTRDQVSGESAKKKPQPKSDFFGKEITSVSMLDSNHGHTECGGRGVEQQRGVLCGRG